ncbi:hypothetical protein QQF64_018480 [Cirrhinus molitorella]|uniref:Uncharacterized protein n=1 Tax=Cirrhinus molitorella TaxID=172907 RepID=A0ABR3LCP1_9TELE
MVEEGLTTPWGRPTVAEQVEVEPEAESRISGATQRIRRAKAEQMAPATEAEAEIRRAAVEPERSRTEAELEGRRSPAEPEGRSDEAQPEEWSPEAMAG